MDGFLDEKVPYIKKPLSVKTQVAKLKRRGLIIDDENLAGDYLSNISYYLYVHIHSLFRIMRIRKKIINFFVLTFILRI